MKPPLSFAQLVGQFQAVQVGTLLWLRKAKTNAAGTAPVMLRVYIGPDRIELSTGLRATAEQWAAGQLVGKGKLVAQQNAQLQLLKAHVPELVNLMKATGRKITISTLRQQLKAPAATASPCYLAICQQASESRDKASPTARAAALNALRAVADWHGRERRTGEAKPLPLDEFTPRRAAEFYHWLLTGRKVKVATANAYVGTLRGLFKYAAELGEVEIGDNPLRALRKQKAAPAPARLHLTLAQVELLRTAELPPSEGLARDVYLTQYYLHGSRVGAVLKLRWADVGPEAVWLQVEKGGQGKAVALCEPLREILARQGQGGGLVFPTLLGADFFALDADGQAVARHKATARLNAQLARVAARLGIAGRLHSHTARHSLAGHAAELGGLEVAQGMLGHTAPAMTARYAGAVANPALAAVEQQLYGGGTVVRPMWEGGQAA